MAVGIGSPKVEQAGGRLNGRRTSLTIDPRGSATMSTSITWGTDPRPKGPNRLPIQSTASLDDAKRIIQEKYPGAVFGRCQTGLVGELLTAASKDQPSLNAGNHIACIREGSGHYGLEPGSAVDT